MSKKNKNKEIVYKKKWFNPLFFIIESEIKRNAKLKRVLIYGGKSSSKTVSVCQYIAKKGISETESAILFRKESARVKSTVKKTFSLAIETTRLDNAWFKLDRKFRCINGAEVLLAGLDNEDKAKGVEGFNYILFDELDQFTKQEYQQVNLSLRGQGDKIFFCTWNPVSKNSWVKKELVDTYNWIDTGIKLPNPKSTVKLSSCKTTLLIHTNYKDNYWTVGSPCGTYGYVDDNLLDDYHKLKETDKNAYNVNVLGLWGNTSLGGEFYKSFNHNKHVSKISYDKDLPIHISFDENVNPYLSLSVYQTKGSNIFKIDEICLEHPFNTLKDAVNKFMRKYTNKLLKVYIYGDRTSLKQDTKLEKGQNFFTIIVSILRNNGYSTELRLPNRNPSVHLRGVFINAIFRENIYNINYTISEDCILTIEDYENLKEASDGTKHKSKIRNPITKVTYEQYGHLSDTDDYFICEYFKKEFKEFTGTKSMTLKRGRVL